MSRYSHGSAVMLKRMGGREVCERVCVQQVCKRYVNGACRVVCG